MKKEKIILLLFCFFLAISNACALNLGNPTVLIPTARLAFGASYDVGGYTIANDSVPCMMNRFQGHCTFAPLSFLNVGINAGASRMDVAADTTAVDTIGIFEGNYGFSGGMNVLLGSHYFYNDLFRVIGIVKGTFFSSTNDNGAVYSGVDGGGALGLQFRIPRFGFFSLGPEIYLISGKNKSYLGKKHRYSNISNLRGWMAIDFFPKEKITSDNKFFLSLEMAMSPQVKFNKQAPMQEIRFSVGFGSMTKRLYGEVSDFDWTP
jgi:hypothetical protein